MMKTAMQQLLDKVKEAISTGQDIEKLIPLLSHQYLPIEQQQLENAYIEGQKTKNDPYYGTGANHYFKTTYYE